MHKRADFGVFRAKHGQGTIVEVEVRPHHRDRFGAPQRAARADVLAAIERGRTFVTVYAAGGTITKGGNVRIVTLDGQKYLRADDDAVRADDLGALLEYR